MIPRLVRWTGRLWPRGSVDHAAPGHLTTGIRGERIAEKHLKQKRYELIGRRVRVGRRDEIDLIMRSPEDVMVFIEVKTRGSEQFGRPFSSVDRRKREALSRAAMRYLKTRRVKPDFIRFDVVEVVGPDDPGGAVVRHIENAFVMAGNRRLNW